MTQSMTKSAKARSRDVRASGLVGLKKSGQIVVDWDKALRSPYLKLELDGIKKIRESRE